MIRARPLVERFADRKLVRTESGCLEWPGATNFPGGYGVLHGGPGRPGLVYAHRVAWQIAHPDEAPPIIVRHSCDNPPCCEPSHLLAGDHADNVHDMISRGRKRGPRGETHPFAKLTDREVREIRAAYASGGILYRELAELYGVTKDAIGAIVRGDRRASA